MNSIMNWVPGLTLEMAEKMAILQAMQFYKNNKTATANALGIAIRTLDNKLELYAQDDIRMKAVENERARQREEFARRARGQAPSVSQPTPRDSAQSQKASDPVDSLPHPGVPVEPAPDPSEEYPLPVPEPEKVQEVLSPDTSEGRPRRGRPSIYRTHETPKSGV